MPQLLVGAGIAAVAVTLALLLGLIADRWPFAVDRWIMLAVRGEVGGVGWVRNAAINLTALGSVTVLTVVTIAVVGLLLVQRLWLTALATGAACWSGGWAVTLVKNEVSRPRPTLVPHWVDVHNASFPSGHAAGSALVYLTIAALATQVLRDEAARRYVLALAIVLVGAIGISRVVLGVHWPSDVLAGWSFGTLWALAWWKATAAARRSIGGER
jgi:membrane-associated phospholipid phosphatase